MKKRRVKKMPIIILLVIIIGCVVGVMYLMNNKGQSNNKKSGKSVKTSEKVKKDETKKMSLVAVGDCLIHGAVYMDARTGSNSYDFSKMIELVGPEIEKYDLRYYNQETIIGGKKLGVSHYPRFNSPEEIGDNMVDLGFNLISLVNNHTLDKNEEGILNSNEYWKTKNVITAGTYSSQDERDDIKVYEKNGIKYAFLAYTTTTNGLSVPQGKDYLVNVYSEEQVKEDIDKIKDKVDVIIVSMHWGEEYLFEPTDNQKEIAKYLSSLGVNLIIGSHPHVVEPVGYVNDTLVIYSLGNFLSGQRPMGIDKTIGLMVGMDIVVKDKKVTFENVEKSLLYTYSTTSDTNYKVYPFKNLDDSILSGYKELEEKYMGIVNSEVKYD